MDSGILDILHTRLHAEHQRITAKGISIEHSITRSEAESIIEELLYYKADNDYSYDISKYTCTKNGDKLGKQCFLHNVSCHFKVLHPWLNINCISSQKSQLQN